MSLNPSKIYKQKINVIGVMSGTSLDGLDICHCSFEQINKKWEYSIICATTIEYDLTLKNRLSSAFSSSGLELTKLDYDYGRWIGDQVKSFIKLNHVEVDFIASHGHTIFHKPVEGYTLQIGKGSAIAAVTGIPCICDFRSTDICKNGQGAPLVPIGDKHLFSSYDICLNLGGFANISYNQKDLRLAFDIGPCNILINHFANKLGFSMDFEGNLAKNGRINKDLLLSLNNLSYYKLEAPKSLGREWLEETVLPLIYSSNISCVDILATLYEHITIQIAEATNRINAKTILITGGGAHNNFLMQQLQNKSSKSIVIPDKSTIDFKEALIFAFLGVLYIKGEKNALASVTGAIKDSITGCLYY